MGLGAWLSDLNTETAEAGLPAFVPAFFVSFLGLLGIGIPLSVIHNSLIPLPKQVLTLGLAVGVFVGFNVLHLWLLRDR